MTQKLTHKFRLFFIPCLENNHRPKFLASNFLIWCLAFLVVLKLIVIFFLICFPKISFFYDLTADLTKSAIIEMTNQERQTLGINALKINSKLEEAAYLKAKDMIEKDYFAHQSPAGAKPWDWLRGVGYNYQYAGENLAIGFIDSAEVMEAWKESPSHFENILNPNYQEIGIAVLRGEFNNSEVALVVQFFGSSQKEKVIGQKLTQEPEPKKIEPKEEVLSPEEEIVPIEEEEAISGEEQEEFTEKETEKDKIVAGKGAEIPVSPPKNQENSLLFRLFKFMTRDYADFLQKAIFYFLFLIIASLLINIFIKIEIQDKAIIFRTIILIILVSLLFVLDKEIIIQLIPHSLAI